MTRILLLFSLLTLMRPTAESQTLASLLDKSRVLLVFAPTDHDARYQQQLAVLKHHAPEMKDRDLVLIPILSQSGPPTTANTLRYLHPPVISDDEQLTTRNRFRVSPTSFAVILLGKDGGEKLRSPEPLSMDRLDRLIDAMPMRQDEIRQRSHK